MVMLELVVQVGIGPMPHRHAWNPCALSSGRFVTDVDQRPRHCVFPDDQVEGLLQDGSIVRLARYVISVLALPISHDVPCGTIIINVIGSFVIEFSER